jgi:hypothetical protein
MTPRRLSPKASRTAAGLSSTASACRWSIRISPPACSASRTPGGGADGVHSRRQESRRGAEGLGRPRIGRGRHIGPGDITPDEALAGMGAAARGVLTRASLFRRRHPPCQPGFRRGVEEGVKGPPARPTSSPSAVGTAWARSCTPSAGNTGASWTRTRRSNCWRPAKTSTVRAVPCRSIRKPATSCITNMCAKCARSTASSNVELETVATADKDPWKELDKK